MSKRSDGNADYYDYDQPPGPGHRHFIEHTVKVYLRLSDDGTRWIVDGPTVDGHPLDPIDRDGAPSGPTNSECQCGDPAACGHALTAAAALPLPTAVELIGLLAQALPVNADR